MGELVAVRCGHAQVLLPSRSTVAATMPISTGNYDSEGVNRISFPAKSDQGEELMIEEKVARANGTTLLVSEDGRLWESAPQYAQKLKELVGEAREAAMEEVEEIREAVNARLPELLADAKDALAGAVEVAEDAVEGLADAALDLVDEAQEALGAEDTDDRLSDSEDA